MGFLDDLRCDDRSFHVIAEVGNNHQGDVEKCMRLFEAAAAAGATSVKLQKRDNRTLFTREYFDSPYTGTNAFGPTYGLHREFLEFDKSQYHDLKQYASELGIIFWATAFDVPSVDFLVDVGVAGIKIASADLTSHYLLEYAAKTGLPVVFSTGGGTEEEVDAAYEIVVSSAPEVGVLQCTAAYPAPYDSLNLDVILRFQERYRKAVVGYSGHENGIAIPVAAYLLGARIIEKHFTLDRTARGSDQAFSLEPQGMTKMIRDLHRVRKARGTDTKIPQERERAAIVKMGKSIVASRDIFAGSILTMDLVEFRSPGGGLPPSRVEALLGRVTNRNIARGERLAVGDWD